MVLALALLGCGSNSGSHKTLSVLPRLKNKGFLISIKGDVYTMQDFSGRFVQFRVDENTSRERFVVFGERVEMQ